MTCELVSIDPDQIVISHRFRKVKYNNITV